MHSRDEPPPFGHSPGMRPLLVAVTFILLAACSAGSDDPPAPTPAHSESTSLAEDCHFPGPASLDGESLNCPTGKVAENAPPGLIEKLIGVWGTKPPTPAAEASREPWLEFSRDATFSGSDGCNAVSGTWSLDATGSIRIKDLATTFVACENMLDLASMTFDGSQLHYRDVTGRPHTMVAVTRRLS